MTPREAGLNPDVPVRCCDTSDGQELNDVASSAPIFPAVGNHDVYGDSGRKGGWKPGETRRAMAKYRTYFKVPENGSPVPAQMGRYYRVDYGPVTLITLDSSNGAAGQPPDQAVERPAWPRSPIALG